MNLDELQPKEIKFKISGLELVFRPFTIADDLKAQELCGGQDKLAAAFGEQDLKLLTLVGWYQLDLKSQRAVIAAVEGAYIDAETGEEKGADLTPLEKFRSLFWSVRERVDLIRNLLNCRGFNIPDLDDEAGLKKWTERVSPLLRELTGQSFSTLSPRNTATLGDNLSA